MDFIASFYPPLSQRNPIPPLYQPSIFILTLLPFLFHNRRLVAIALFPVILSLCLLAPCYTFGSPPADYYNTSAFIAMPLWYLEFAILSPTKGSEAPIFIGAPADLARPSKKKRQEWSGLTSTWERLYWAFALMIPSHRGVGWNWQARNIPVDPYRDLSRWTYVGKHLTWVGLAYVGSLVTLAVMGCSSSLRQKTPPDQYVVSMGLDAAIGWSGAIWIWYRISCFYSSMAALSVGVGVCETWQWPPLMGDLSNAWSIRNTWSVVYHQTMRMMLQQPARRITRLLRLRQRSIGSRLTQLSISFAISCIVHQYQMFNVTRKDMGEFKFFMTQPIAIIAEVLVQWMWSRLPSKKHNKSRTGTLVGYVWVFLWFSYSLPFYVKGFRDAGVTRDVLLGDQPFSLGFELGEKISKAL